MFGWLFGKRQSPRVGLSKSEFDELTATESEPSVAAPVADDSMPQAYRDAGVDPAFYRKTQAINEAARKKVEAEELEAFYAIADSCAIQANMQIDEELLSSGKKLSDADRFRLKEMRGQRLCLEAITARDKRLNDEYREDERFKELQQIIMANRQKSLVEQVRDIWREHPILAGYFGADIVYRIKDILKGR